MNRRGFLRGAAGAGLALGAGLPALGARPQGFAAGPNLSRVEARHYVKLPDREIECRLCPRLCRLGDKERGYCGVRENIGGTYYTLVYGKVCALNVDPIEKKPFFHVLPGTTALSLATAGCNVNCKFCQNWEISQARPEQVEAFDLAPEAAAARAASSRCPSIAYTYTEPTVYFEYMVDTAVRAKRQGVRNLVVTGGHINPEPLAELLGRRRRRQGRSQGILRGVLRRVRPGRPQAGPRDDPDRRQVEGLARDRGPGDPDPERRHGPHPGHGAAGSGTRPANSVPVHFTRFQPMYLVKNLPPTPVSTLEAARRIALEEGLRFVYVGNVPGHGVGEHLLSRLRQR